MSINSILEDFGQAVGKLKREWAEECGCNPYCLEIHIDQDDYCIIADTSQSGWMTETYRCDLDTRE